MGRECAECQDWLSNRSFSRNQWLKGDGYSRCKDCVSGYNNSSNTYNSFAAYAAPSFTCHECFRDFDTQNQLNMHAQTHRPRNVSCPVCHETRFRSGANAVQHVESGYCSGCLGADNARRQIYEFSNQQAGMQRYITTNVPMLTNGYGGGVPDFPYNCPDCHKAFRQLSQLLQHQDNKHSNYRLLSY